MKWFTFVLMLSLPCTLGIIGSIRRVNMFRGTRPLCFVSTKNFKCSGSLIHLQWVLTSAQCFFYRPTVYDVTVEIATAANFLRNQSDLRTLWGFVYRRPVQIIYQEMQNVPNGRGREVALVRLNAKVYHNLPNRRHYLVSYLVRGPFPYYEMFERTVCHLAGIGYTGRGSIPIANYVRVYAGDGTYCRKFINAPVFYKEICLNHRPGRSSCAGDWGGPVLCAHDVVTLAVLLRTVINRNGGWGRPYLCARSEVTDTFVYTGAIYRYVKYYVPDLPKPMYAHRIFGKHRTDLIKRAAGEQCLTNPIVIFFTILFILCI